MYQYTICNQFDEELFKRQCSALEKNVPNLQKKIFLEDVDGSQTQIYYVGKSKISVHNSEYIGSLYIESEIELEQFFRK